MKRTETGKIKWSLLKRDVHWLMAGCGLGVLLVAGPNAQAQSPKPPTTKVPAGARTSPRPTLKFDELAQRAAAAREADRVDEAVELYSQAVRARPTWGEGWWYWGTLEYDREHFSEAREAFRHLTDLEPTVGAGWAFQGLCEFRLRDYERALEHLQRGRTLGLGGNSELIRVTRYHTAILLNRFGEFEAGLQLLQAIARDQGENPTLLEAMGISTLALPFLPAELPADYRELVIKAGRAAYYLAARRMDDAKREFEELVARYPNSPNVHYSYGVFLLINDTDKALEEFRRELTLFPSNVSARLQIAFECIKRSDFRSALPFAEEAVRLSPLSFPAHNALGRTLLELGDTQRAIEELEESARLAPDSPETRYVLARAYSRAGRKDEAERERAEFTRLDRIRRQMQQTSQPTATSEPPSEGRPPG